MSIKNIKNIKLYQNGNWIECKIDPNVLVGDSDFATQDWVNGIISSSDFATQEWVNETITGKVDYLRVVKNIDELSECAREATSGDYCRAGQDFELTGSSEDSETEQVHIGDILIYKLESPAGENDYFNTSDYWDVIHSDQVINIEDGIGNNSIQTRGYNAEVKGEGSAYIGGIRYDDLEAEDATEAIIAETAKQSFAAGGGIQIYGDWSVGFNKETSVYQRGAAAFGGGSKAGRTEEEFNRYFWSAFYDNDYTKPDPQGEPLHGGGYLTNEGRVTDTENKGTNANGQRIGRTYDKAYSFAFATGEVNKALGRASFIGGGSFNESHSKWSHIGAGYQNKVYGNQSAIEGGQYNTIAKTPWNAAILGGDHNEITATGGGILGGANNTVKTVNAVILGGANNQTDWTAERSVVLGGWWNQARGLNSAVGGQSSFADSRNSFVFGEGLNSNNDNQSVFGKYNNKNNNALFQVGNGNSTTDLNNAFEVLNDGRIVAGADATEGNGLVRLGQLDSFLVSKDVAYKSDLNSYVLTSNFISLLNNYNVAYESDLDEYVLKTTYESNIDDYVLKNNFGTLLTSNNVAYKTDIYTAAADGGIEIDDDNKITLSEDFLQYLSEQTYKSPSISTLQLFLDNDAILTSVEVGTTVEFNKIKHKETNIGNITGNLTLRKGNSNSDIIKNDIVPVNNDTTISISSQAISNTGAGSKSIKLEGTNSRDSSFSRSVTISFYWPQFYKVTDEENWNNIADNPGARTQKITDNNNNCTIEISNKSQYVYFRFVSEKRITMNGIDVDFLDDENGTTQSLDINGVSKNYYCYRTAKKLMPGTYIFNIVEKGVKE